MPRQKRKNGNAPDLKGAPPAQRRKRTARSAARKSKTASSKHLALKFAALAFVLMIAGVIYCFDLDTAGTDAMQPAIVKGDLVLSWAPPYPRCNPLAGTIVSRTPAAAAEPEFLRVVASNAAEVAFADDRIKIDGNSPDRLALTNPAIARPESEPEIWRETLKNGAQYRILLPQQPLSGALKGTVRLENGQVFLIGDNRMASYDSRQMGPVGESDIRGCALFVLRSSGDDGILGHWIKPIF